MDGLLGTKNASAHRVSQQLTWYRQAMIGIGAVLRLSLLRLVGC